MQTTRIMENQICFDIKNDYNLYWMFDSRYKLNKYVYGHKAVQALDFMFTDILVAANGYYRFDEMLLDP